MCCIPEGDDSLTDKCVIFIDSAALVISIAFIVINLIFPDLPISKDDKLNSINDMNILVDNLTETNTTNISNNSIPILNLDYVYNLRGTVLNSNTKMNNFTYLDYNNLSIIPLINSVSNEEEPFVFKISLFLKIYNYISDGVQIIFLLISLYCIIDYAKEGNEDPDYDSHAMVASMLLCFMGVFGLLFLASNIVGLVFSCKLLTNSKDSSLTSGQSDNIKRHSILFIVYYSAMIARCPLKIISFLL